MIARPIVLLCNLAADYCGVAGIQRNFNTFINISCLFTYQNLVLHNAFINLSNKIRYLHIHTPKNARLSLNGWP